MLRVARRYINVSAVVAAAFAIGCGSGKDSLDAPGTDDSPDAPPTCMPACAGGAPICDLYASTCRACVAHTECASAACLPDGSCGEDTSVAYVDPTGTDGANCSKAQPCRTVVAALATMRPTIKITGMLAESVTVQDRKIAFIADPQARLTAMPSASTVMNIAGASDVAIYDLTIRGGDLGVAVASAAKAKLVRVTVEMNRAGVTSLGDLSIAESRIVGNGQSLFQLSDPAIDISGGSVSIARSRITDNPGGGIISTNAAFDIRNNFIVHNGFDVMESQGGSRYGGVLLAATGNSRFVFNTVVGNSTAAQASFTYYPGVRCTGSQVEAHGNLLAGNLTGDGDRSNQLSGTCSFGNTHAQDSVELGFGWSESDRTDMHLTAATPSTVIDAGGSCTGDDYDGYPRPLGAACDLGADEFK
jgi:hypothetical protein